MSFSSDKGGKKPSHETALRPYLERKVISPDSLTPNQKRSAEQLIAYSCPPGGVLVGALLGEFSWDVRPLVLEKGIVSIVRSSSPDLNSAPEKYFNLKDIYLRLRPTRLGQKLGLSFGENDQKLWVKRKFYPKTLGQEKGSLDSKKMISELCAIVQSFHDLGILHGHIHAGNAAVENGDPVIFDFGFAAYSPVRKGDLSSAPELLQGGAVSLATDVCGLGLMIKDTLSDGVSPEARASIESMSDRDPIRRPTLFKVAQHFIASKISPAISSPQEMPQRVLSRHDPLRQGKLLQSSVEIQKDSSINRVQPINSVSEREEESFSSPASANRSIRERLRERTIKEEPPVTPTPRKIEEISEREEPASKELAPSRPSTALLNIILLILIGGGGYWWYSERSGINALPYDSYWRSGQSSLMLKVAEDAIARPDSSAAQVIIDEALAGKRHPPVQDGILRFAFHPEWRESLSRADKVAALRISLIGLVPSTPEQVEIVEGRHPALLLGLVGNIPDNALAKELSNISIGSLGELPDPYGEAFRSLETLGVQALSDPMARALCHLFVGNASQSHVESYFAPSHEEEAKNLDEAIKKLSALLPALGENVPLRDMVFETLLNGDFVLGDRLRWFQEDTLGLWNENDRTTMLSLAAGVFPADEFSFEQNADLTQFPGKGVRKEAGARVLSKFSAKFDFPLLYLRGSEHKFTRQQVVLLLSAMRQKGEASYPIIDTWIHTRPDPQSVLGLLVSDAGIEGLDAFNVEAARYLKDKDWKANIQQLRILASHKDVLARALAYARLDPKNPEEALILKEAATREPKLNLRASLVEKLGGSAPPPDKELLP